MTQLAIDHLWQSTLFVLLVGALTLAFRRDGAHIRFGLWFAASLKFLVPFPLIVAAGKLIPWSSAPTIPADAPWAEALGTVVAPSNTLGELIAPLEVIPPDLTLPPDILAPAAAPLNLEPWLWALWACGVGAVILWRTGQWLRVRAAVMASAPLPIAAPIQVLSSPTALEPGLIGILQPVLVLPEGIAERLTPRQLEAVLAHELCHWRRRDNLTAAVHMLVEALFWFHPLVWWIEGRLVAEREHACDERVLAEGVSPRAYADSVVAVCRFYMRTPLVAAGMSGADLQTRVARIVRNAAVRRLSGVKAFALAILALATLIAPLAIGAMTPAEAVAEFEPAPPQIAENTPTPLPTPAVPEIAPTPQPAPRIAPAPRGTDKLPKVQTAPGQPSVSTPCLLGTDRCVSDTELCLLDAASCKQHEPALLPTINRIGSVAETQQVAALNGVQPQATTQPAPSAAPREVVLSPQAQSFMASGKAQLAKKKFRQAAEAFTAVLGHAPESAEALLLRGNAYAADRKFPEAIADYDAAIQHAPNDAEAYLRRGNAYFVMAASWSGHDPALADYDAAIRLRPDDAVAYNNRGYATGSMADLDTAIRLAPDFAIAYFNRGIMWAASGQKDSRERAKAELREAVRLLSNNNSQKWITAGALPNGDRGSRPLFGGGDRQALLARARWGVSGTPQYYDQDQDAYPCVRGNLRDTRCGDPLFNLPSRPEPPPPPPTPAPQSDAGAMIKPVAWQQLAANPDDSVEALLSLGEAQLAKKNFHQAVEAFTAVLGPTPESAEVLLLRGNAYAADRKYAQAIADYDAAIQRAPNNAEAYLRRGNAHLVVAASGTGRDPARADYDMAIRLKPDYAVAYNNRAYASRSLADVDTAIQLAPDFAIAYFIRGGLWAASGQKDARERATADLREAIRLLSDEDSQKWIAAGALPNGDGNRPLFDGGNRKTLLARARAAINGRPQNLYCPGETHDDIRCGDPLFNRDNRPTLEDEEIRRNFNVR